jgi:hypothetical protein
MAYCLLSLFHVNMPLLYGEGGSKAFLRLQHEILKSSDDESIFVWKQNLAIFYLGILAPSPSAFAGCGDIIVAFVENRRLPYTMANKGLEFHILLASQTIVGLSFRKVSRA